VMFYPEDTSFNTLVQTIRKSCRTVELFEIARTVVAHEPVVEAPRAVHAHEGVRVHDVLFEGDRAVGVSARLADVRAWLDGLGDLC